MRKTERITAFALCAVLISFTFVSCKNVGKFASAGPELKIGVRGVEGTLNPFYCESDADKEIVSQMFRSVQRRGRDNKLINYGGGISYELVGEDKVKYFVSIRNDMRFSDGQNVTIDDVIFFYHVIADASYDGPYKDWYLNDLEGLKEFYYDDENYKASTAAIEKTVKEKYSAATISAGDYAEYLVATKLEGKFRGLESPSPSGVSWRAYLEKLGYSEELKSIGDGASSEAALRLAAKAEAENDPLSYDPENWHRKLLYSNYIKKNYGDGTDVPEIAGVKKIDDYSCSVLFNSRNINAVSELNVPIVSKKYYSAKYVKGSASKIKELEGFPVCSGPYCAVDADASGVLTSANKYYSDAECEFKTVKFVNLGESDADLVQSVVSGKVDVVQTVASDAVAKALTDKPVKSFITDCDYYTTAFFNPRSLDSAARKALMGLFSVEPTLDKNVGSYYTRLFTPLSARFAGRPSDAVAPYYNESAYTAYEMLRDDKLKDVSAYCVGDKNGLEYALLTDYKEKLAAKGITLIIVLADEAELENAIAGGEADIWIAKTPDGATLDKYDYFNGAGRFNKTGLNDPEINALTEEIRAGVGFVDKTRPSARLMKLVMEKAVEYPLYQLQVATIYNTDKISEDSFPDDKNFDGYTHVLPYLKKK